MFRCLFSAILFLGLLAQTVLGAGIHLIEGLPSSYTPGQPVTFDVRLPAITNLGSYNIDLVLESTVGTAGVDFFFDVAATVPAAASYVFPSASNFFDSVNVDSATRHRITLTDFDFSGVNLVAGVNDRVASVVFRTAPSFSKPLNISIDASSLILDTPDVTPTPVDGFETFQTDIGATPPVELPSVPEPSGIILGLSVVFIVPALNQRRRRRLSQSVA